MRAFIVVSLLVLSGCAAHREPCSGPLQSINQAPSVAIDHPSEHK
jgi:hypothetical protein